MTDQHENERNKFEIFDRQTLNHLATFRGKVTRNTDGIWLSRKAFGPFKKGAFFPVGSITAMSLTDIGRTLNLRMECPTQ